MDCFEENTFDAVLGNATFEHDEGINDVEIRTLMFPPRIIGAGRK